MASAAAKPKERTYKGDSTDTADSKESRQASAEARKWKKELALAEKREKDWVGEGQKIIKRYRSEEARKNKYNVLWANTETLQPAIYNSKPQPDVRRRFADADPVGKAVSEILDRSLTYTLDGDVADEAISNDVLDALLPGRGISRVLYVPKISPAGAPEPKAATKRTAKPAVSADTEDTSDDAGEGIDVDGSKPGEGVELDLQELEFEQAVIEHVDWEDFRHGYGRSWPEVEWVGFRHKMNRKDSTEKFGKEALSGIDFAVEKVEDGSKYHEKAGSSTKVAEFWEIWSKTERKVFFINTACERCLYPLDNLDGEPPIDFPDFFPCPKPLMLVANTSSLLPIPPFNLYEDQAQQLDVLTSRIDRIVKALKLRGVYDAKLAEIPDLLSGDDNQLTPVKNAAIWADSGGLDKAIAWMPIEQAAAVLSNLYEARDRQKAIIDELTGIADIVRGATDPDETLGAQQLKSGYHSVRLWRMQAEVKRYARDLLRLVAAVMCQKFGVDTFQAMTDLKLPTAEQKQGMTAAFAQWQQAQAAPPPMTPPPPQAPPGPPGAPPGPMPGGPPVGAAPPPPAQPPFDPQLLQVPTWEDCIGLMHSPSMRQFRIDVETDSTISGTIQADMAGLSEVLQAISGALTAFGPLVANGSMPADAAKQLIMQIIRRSRMGSAVEDAFDKMKAPPPPPDPNQAKADAAVKQTQMQEATKQHTIEVQAQHDDAQQQAQIAADKQAGQAKLLADQHALETREQAENQRLMFEESAKKQREQFLEMQKTAREENEARFDAFVKIIVATISATKAADPNVQPAADEAVGGSSGKPQPAAPAPDAGAPAP